MYFGFYTCTTELIHVFQILYMYYRGIYLSYGSYSGLTELILVLRNLYLCYKIDSYISALIHVRRYP